MTPVSRKDPEYGFFTTSLGDASTAEPVRRNHGSRLQPLLSFLETCFEGPLSHPNPTLSPQQTYSFLGLGCSANPSCLVAVSKGQYKYVTDTGNVNTQPCAESKSHNLTFPPLQGGMSKRGTQPLPHLSRGRSSCRVAGWQKALLERTGSNLHPGTLAAVLTSG